MHSRTYTNSFLSSKDWRGNTPKTFYEATHHPDNKTPSRKENHRPVSSMNIDAKAHLKRQHTYTQKTKRHSGKKSRMTQTDGEVELEEPILQKRAHCPKWNGEVQSLSRVQLSATPWTVAHQAPLSMGFCRQEYWSGSPFPSSGDLPDPGIEPRSPTLQADALTSEPPGKLSTILYYPKQSLQIWCNLYQTTNSIFHRIRTITFAICKETQKTPNG